MFLRMDKLLIDLPKPKEADANAGAAVQELMGGRFGEMSTLMNYMSQSFNFRERKKLKPYYDLVANIATEELAHIELVSHTINMVVTGSTKEGMPADAPLNPGKDFRNTLHFISTAQTMTVANSMQQPWSGDYVFNSGNLVLDLLHNFFLECGARTQKMRVYEMTDNETARQMIGYLLVRGGVHTVAYAKALHKLTGVDMTKMLPIPNLENNKFPEARKFEEEGRHRWLYRFSPDDYRGISQIWTGTHPEDDSQLEVVDGPPEGAEIPDLEGVTESFAPGVSKEDIEQMAKTMMANM